MHYLPDKIDNYLRKAREADITARAQPDEESKLGWLRVAASWRLLAERTLVERTGGELLLH